MFVFGNELGCGVYQLASGAWEVCVPDLDHRAYATRDDAVLACKTYLRAWIDANGAQRLGLLLDALGAERGANVTASRRVSAHAAVDNLA